MTTSQKLSKIGELLDEVIEDVEHPDPMSPEEVTNLFLDHLEGFDACEFENALNSMNEAVKKMVDSMLQTQDFAITSPMMRVQCHFECAYEAWKNRSGN